MNSGLRPVWWQVGLVAVAIVCAAWVFRNPGAQSVNWTFPYFSGAANFESITDWRISPAEYAEVRGMSAGDYRAHRHGSASQTVSYSYNNYGYVLVVVAARTLFGWMGEGDAVATLQLLVHIAISLALFALLSTPARRWTFVLLYALNPLVLHLVTFPYYYFWTVVPCALLALVWLRRDRIGACIVPIALILCLCCLIRPPVLFVCLLVLAIAFRPGQRVATAIAGALFALGLMFVPVQTYSSPWHTAYIGVGAYPNPYGIAGPQDERAFEHYLRLTGVQIDTNPIDGSFQQTAQRERYWAVMRGEYFAIAAERPWLLIRNAAFNTVEAFGLGYDVSRSWVTLLSGLAGLVMIGLIVWSRAWIWGAGILFYAAAFVPYFPPIPAYLFGAYLLSALAAGHVVDALLARWRGPRQPTVGGTSG